MQINQRLTPACLTALLLSMLVFPLQTHAQPPPALSRTLLAARQPPPTLEQAVTKIKKETGGRILTAETVKHEGRLVHRIKVLLPNGHVRVTYTRAE